ncbi:SCP2 sterol-binding domain-containing protein [Silvimonas sp. JCM 19000]
MNPDWLLPLRRIAPHLPEAPAGFVVCQTLNLAVRRLWPDEDFMWLQGKTARLAVSDLGCGVTLSYTGGRFIHSSKAADVTLRAELAGFTAMLRGQTDPDTLFFQRKLQIEGDTELGLHLKNWLDTTDRSALASMMPGPLARWLQP